MNGKRATIRRATYLLNDVLKSAPWKVLTTRSMATQAFSQLFIHTKNLSKGSINKHPM
jgi:hypothetical protein